MLKTLSTNRLTTSPAYPKILHQYNEILQNEGKVNSRKFYEDVVKKEIPNYALQTWYSFLKRFKTSGGLIEADPTPGGYPTQEIEAEVQKTMLSNQDATVALIRGALNISALAARRIVENPELLSVKDQIELGLKAMKAQDSRIHAIGKVREDNREEEKFNRAFSDANY